MCIRDRLGCTVPKGYLFYGQTHSREEVFFTQELRDSVKKTAAEMHDLYARRHTPKSRRSKSCNACSIKDFCIPALGAKPSVQTYIRSHLEEEE